MANRNANCSFCRKNYRDVGPLVEGPGDVFICCDCIDLCRSIIDQEKRRRRFAGGAPPAPTLESVRGRLDQLVAGEDDAKAPLVQVALRHHEHGGRSAQSPVLLIGPARSSKVFLARALAHAVEIPFAQGDAQALVRPGPEVVDPLLLRLLNASAYNLEEAQRGIIYLDGVDERAAQEALLRLWESRFNPHLRIDVTRPLFLLGGAFAGLDAVLTGMGRHPEQPVTAEALLEFGVAPEVVRRLEVIVRVAPLEDATLARVLPWVDFDRMAGGEG
jgi:ATP-dependent Clp protease ATP-binding subunit ClpX